MAILSSSSGSRIAALAVLATIYLACLVDALVIVIGGKPFTDIPLPVLFILASSVQWASYNFGLEKGITLTNSNSVATLGNIATNLAAFTGTTLVPKAPATQATTTTTTPTPPATGA